MAQRTTAGKVRAVIESDAIIDMQAFIDAATALADKVAAEDSGGDLSVALLLQIETMLAAHFYESYDPQLTQERTEGASASYQGMFGKRLDGSKWGQHAIVLDVTGYLRALNEGVHTLTVEWLGLPPSDQTDYADRD